MHNVIAQTTVLRLDQSEPDEDQLHPNFETHFQAPQTWLEGTRCQITIPL